MDVLTFKGYSASGFYMGVELEVEATHGEINRVVAERLIALMGDFAVIKHDGSLVNGFEIVSAPATFEEHYRGWAKVFRPDDGKGRLNLASWNSPRCGMHVHMSREAIPPLHLARMMSFVYSSSTRRLIEVVAGRNLHSGWGERYTEINSRRKITDVVGTQTNNVIVDRGTKYVRVESGFMELQTAIDRGQYVPGPHKIVKKYYDGADNRYTALNDTNTATVELRIFRGTLYEPSFYKNIEFCHAMWSFTKPGATSLKDLENPVKFCEYVEKNSSDYRNLYRFLQRKEKLIKQQERVGG
jgi:hypothetical protein